MSRNVAIGIASFLVVGAILYFVVGGYRLRQWVGTFLAHRDFNKAIDDPAEKDRILREIDERQQARIGARIDAAREEETS